MVISNNYYYKYLKDLLVLACPMFIGVLGHTLVGITDVILVARYNIKALSAISIANALFFTIMILGIGILNAVSIILSNFRGAKYKTKKYLFSTLFLSFVLSFIAALFTFFTQFFISNIGFEKDLIPSIKEYLAIVSFSIFGTFIFEGIKQFLQSFEIVKLPNFLQLSAVFLNILLDIIFIYGIGFIPEMGASGAAISTLIIRFLMAFILFIYVFKIINFKSEIDFFYIKNIIKTGLPIGLAFLFEFLAFNIVAVLVGIEEGILAAVHSILITIASTTFMIPLALSNALSVKVAYWYGAKKPLEVKNYSYTAFWLIICFMSLISIILLVFPKTILSIFTSDFKVLNIAIPLLSILSAYQIFDGFQAVASSILKGFKLTKIVTIIVIASYWFIGAPIAYLLVSKYSMSIRGYWIALAISLCCMGLIQAVIAKYYYKRFTDSLNLR